MILNVVGQAARADTEVRATWAGMAGQGSEAGKGGRITAMGMIGQESVANIGVRMQDQLGQCLSLAL